jgi:hypothetical protein
MHKALCFLGAAGLMLATVATGFAQQPQNVRVRGTIEQIEGSAMTVKSRQGETLKVLVADDARVSALTKASLSDIKLGGYVGATAMPEADGRWKALEVHIFQEAMRGTGIGDRPHDLSPKSTMTNGTIDNLSSGTVGGTAANAGGMTLTLNYKDGEKKIDVTPETVVVFYLPGSKDDLKAGAKIYITASTKQADGTLLMTRVNAGRDGLTPPM